MCVFGVCMCVFGVCMHVCVWCVHVCYNSICGIHHYNYIQPQTLGMYTDRDDITDHTLSRGTHGIIRNIIA